MNTSLSKDELYDLLIDADTIFEFFKVIRDNNLTLIENGSVHNGNKECILNVGDEFNPSEIMYNFYNYWLKHNSSPTNSLGFINLRC